MSCEICAGEDGGGGGGGGGGGFVWGVLLYGHVSVCFNLLVISREEKHFF